MRHPMLFLHWKQAQWVLLPAVVLAFGLPVMHANWFEAQVGPGTSALFNAIAGTDGFHVLYPVLAAYTGMAVALSAWSWDHAQKHVYALSLPMARWEYVLRKMGAGTVLAVLPGVGLWIGAHMATFSLDLPEGIRAYPDALALRFTLATLVSFALLFALGATTLKRASWLMAGLFVFLIVGSALSDFLSDHVAFFAGINAMEELMKALVSPGGPLEVFNGNWALIDV